MQPPAEQQESNKNRAKASGILFNLSAIKRGKKWHFFQSFIDCSTNGLPYLLQQKSNPSNRLLCKKLSPNTDREWGAIKCWTKWVKQSRICGTALGVSKSRDGWGGGKKQMKRKERKESAIFTCTRNLIAHIKFWQKRPPAWNAIQQKR